VDAHLYGGIPECNINELKVLKSIVPNILADSLKEKRSGYVELVKSIDEISEIVLKDERIKTISNELEIKIKEYINHYWDILKNLDESVDLKVLMEEMLIKVKEILSAYKYVDAYDGFQVVAEIWKNSLTHDAEIIALNDFYTLGRTREPNMVKKGTGDKKREEQDGWVGSLVPCELIEIHLYKDERKTIEDKKAKVLEYEAELTELIEATTVEDSVEANVLGELLNESGEAFDGSKIKSEIKKFKKGSIEFELINKVEKLLSSKASVSKEIKLDEKELKDAIQERILTLTNEEIDSLVYEKWF